MRGLHDKRLRFYIVIVRLSLAIFACLLIFVTFWHKMAVLRISQKYSFVNRNFENLKFPNILTLLCNNFRPLRPLLLFPCCIGRSRCASLAECHTPCPFFWFLLSCEHNRSYLSILKDKKLWPDQVSSDCKSSCMRVTSDLSSI